MTVTVLKEIGDSNRLALKQPSSCWGRVGLSQRTQPKSNMATFPDWLESPKTYIEVLIPKTMEVASAGGGDPPSGSLPGITGVLCGN